MYLENERADAGRDGRTRLLVRPINSQAGTGTGKINFLCSADHKTDYWQPYRLSIHTLLKKKLNTMTVYIYIHTYIELYSNRHPPSLEGEET